ncbi:helix-turn-helix domain-containing protein [Pseudoduganella namucuonensis]|uniref:Transcriptional regulator, AraC family n=1 Tax=Pseudoduganella namucuonensis TaxID=1035707 RepID=A0A1I7GVE2_9BURK|nr:AraC family transcriptional regulator [Pseudoduganella namucuonensis]SFU52379.1 transcriptional regulator, AraC family [Pseudoduganella namucuonensis]
MKVTNEHVTHPDQAFRYIRFTCDPLPGKWHRHRQLELTWIENGSGIRYVGDDASPYADGDLALIGANLPHIWDVDQPDVYAIEVTVIQFAPELLELAALPELGALRAVIDGAQLGLRIDGRCRGEVTRLLAGMRELNPLMRLSAFIALLAALAEHAADLHPIAASPVRDAARPERDRRVERVVEWIHTHLGGPLRVEDAAALACVTPAAFSRFFRRETGKPFSRYVSDVRCSAACLRLTRGAAPVALIAEQCGYATLSNFNRQFLARMGMTPRAFRRQHKHPGL